MDTTWKSKCWPIIHEAIFLCCMVCIFVLDIISFQSKLCNRSRTGKKGPYAAYFLQLQPGASFVGKCYKLHQWRFNLPKRKGAVYGTQMEPQLLRYAKILTGNLKISKEHWWMSLYDEHTLKRWKMMRRKWWLPLSQRMLKELSKPNQKWIKKPPNSVSWTILMLHRAMTLTIKILICCDCAISRWSDGLPMRRSWVKMGSTKSQT